jgi:hypothetical protein
MTTDNPSRYSLNGEIFVALRELLNLSSVENFSIKVFNYDRHKGNIHKSVVRQSLTRLKVLSDKV